MVQSAPRARRRRRLAGAWRRITVPVQRRILPTDGLSLLAVTVLAIVLTAISLRYPSWVPLSSLTLALYLGGFLLTLRSLIFLFAATTALVVFAVSFRYAHPGSLPVGPGVVLLLVATGALVLAVARNRRRLGVRGTRGESMFVDLRDRLAAQGELPTLPAGWGAEVALSSAYGASFSGDFIVASRSADGSTLEVVLVDVSGKGLDAGSRALLLSGAFGGLLGAMPSGEFLPAANQYLLRQRWSEGFATAVHLVVDLDTGRYCVTSAGHPPAAQFVAGSGQWRVIETIQGPLLGVVEDSVYLGEEGCLDRGDALLLYTDGLIEAPGRDLSEGIDRLLGEAERLVTGGFRGGARRLVNAVGRGRSDDRALVMIWRD